MNLVALVCWAHRWLQLAVDGHGAQRRVGGEALVPLAGPRFWHRLHKTPLQLADTSVVTHDLGLGLIQVLQQDVKATLGACEEGRKGEHRQRNNDGDGDTMRET